MIRQKFLIILIFFVFVGCKDPEAERKIDATLKAELVQLKQTSEMKQPITVLFRVNEDLTELHHVVLKKNDVKIKANIGSIYTATLPAKSVYNLAKMRFVDYIQGQKKLKAMPADSSFFEK